MRSRPSSKSQTIRWCCKFVMAQRRRSATGQALASLPTALRMFLGVGARMARFTHHQGDAELGVVEVADVVDSWTQHGVATRGRLCSGGSVAPMVRR